MKENNKYWSNGVVLRNLRRRGMFFLFAMQIMYINYEIFSHKAKSTGYKSNLLLFDTLILNDLLLYEMHEKTDVNYYSKVVGREDF